MHSALTLLPLVLIEEANAIVHTVSSEATSKSTTISLVFIDLVYSI